MEDQADRAYPLQPHGRGGKSGTETAATTVLDWLQSAGARYQDTVPFVEAFAAELLRAGIDVWRLTTGVHIRRPQIDASSCLWQSGKPVTERRFGFTLEGMRQLQNSPMPIVYRGGTVRCRLELPPEPGEFPIQANLQAEGVTEHLGLPLPFSDGWWNGVAY